jgi:beta-lactamase superfamily II metal-dependent hydrolase
MSTIKSISVGNGDMFYIRHGSDNFTIIDCCMSEENRENIVKELQRESKSKGITRFISTHPDQDHIGGLEYLDDQMNILNFYCVKNAATKEDETTDFLRYCTLRDHDTKAFYLFKGCSRKWMNQDSDERESSGINILWPVRTNTDFKAALESAADGESPNNISPIIKYSLNGGVTALWMGDLEADFMAAIEDEVDLPEKVDLLFAPHHGRKSGRVPTSWLEAMDPGIIIVGEAPATELEYYDGYDTITQNTAGDIVFNGESGAVHVYVSSESYSVAFLTDEGRSDDDGYYLGTLYV